MTNQNTEKAASIHPSKRLHTALAEMIANVPAGERLPSEPDLARQLNVSRATLREAMRTFESQGLIRRRQGVGTFVVGQQHVIETGIEVLESINTIARRQNFTVSMGRLEVQELPAGEEEAGKLALEIGAPVLKISRVMNAQGRPAAYLTDILPQGILSKAVFGDDFTGSVMDILLKQQALPPAKSLTEIQAAAAPVEIARALQIQRGDVMLRFTACLYAENGRVIDYSYSYFLPGIFRFHVVRSVGNGHTGFSFSGQGDEAASR